MICSKCGMENDEGSLFCNKCGEKLTFDEQEVNKLSIQEETGSKKSFIDKLKESRYFNTKKKLTVSLLGIIILIIFISVYALNGDIRTFKEFYNNKKYQEAKDFYNKIEKNNSENKQEKFENDIKEYFSSKIKDIQTSFISNKDKTDCNEELEILNNMAYYKTNSTEVNSAKGKIENLKNSRVAFKDGQEFSEKKRYFQAIEEFEKVIKEDSNYNESQNKIKTLFPLAKKEKLLEAEKCFKSKDYSNALDSITVLLKYFPNDKELKQKESLYQKENQKAEEIVAKQKEKRKQAILSQMNKYVDSVTNEIMYVPKPYGEKLDISRNGVIFYPYLRGEVGSDVLKLIVGFNKEDWVFMNKIICNADGEVFDINFEYFDRKTEVGFGSGVYEWVEIPSFDTFDMDTSSMDKNPNLINNLKKLSKAKVALVKFQGDTKAFDYTLTSSQKSTLLNVAELHEMCKK